MTRAAARTSLSERVHSRTTSGPPSPFPCPVVFLVKSDATSLDCSLVLVRIKLRREISQPVPGFFSRSPTLFSCCPSSPSRSPLLFVSPYSMSGCRLLP